MEQIRGIGTNPRSDIYSLSATLYQLMTNVVPADALSRADTMLNGLSDPIEQPHALNPEVPAAVSEVILKGMEVSQEKRFGNARDMQKALRRAFTQMQEAMAAQTVAFNIGDMLPADEPLSSAVEKTRLMPSEPLEKTPPVESAPVSHAGNDNIDLDATLAFDPVENLEHAKQAAVGSDLYAPSSEANGNQVLQPAEPIPAVEDDLNNSFVTVAAGAASAFAGLPPVPNVTAEPKKAAPKKSSGKALAVIGGLVAVLVLVAGAAGAGWYFYNNYLGATAVVEPTPSPQPAVEATPMPSPTAEAVVETNSNTNTNPATIAESNLNSNANGSSSDLPTRTEAQIPAPRTNPAAPRTATTRPTTTAPKSTPKQKANPGRTDILQ
jgi:hypothetical protein